MLLIAAVIAVLWFVGFAYAGTLWQVAVLVALESAFGWPLYHTASGAMIADLTPPGRRAEAFSISRVALNCGVVAGPALGGLALAAGLSFRQLFLIAAAGCFGFLILVVAGIRETRPATADEPGRTGARGYRLVLDDRRFLAFCLVALLPVSCVGIFISLYPVFVTDTIGVPYGTWGLLLALNALTVAVVQYPLVRGLRRADHLVLLAVASVLVGLGLGLSGFVTVVWPLAVLVVVMSFGEMLLSPIATTLVSEMAPEEVRGRYMGVWALVWNGGMALGPAVAGLAMDGFGSRPTFVGLIGIGAAGAAGFLVLRMAGRRRRAAGVDLDG
jgi:MFS family permease